MLAFALGIYLPISINAAVLAGAFVSYLVGKTGGAERVKKARQDQGILIASGLMAGAAIFGIVTAVLRQPGLGAPIRFIAIGEKFVLEQTEAGEAFLESTSAAWYEGFDGQVISLMMFVGLGLVCFLLARAGADWSLREEAEAEAAEAASEST
ncbi:MAG: hypothetical protein GX621_04105, partial [Pirellulaceae bacterium]|nr:hypothetical protein [Pirellulaceae bacterium]